MTFAEKLRILREKANLSQNELAKRLGITRSRIAHYELNNREPDYETLVKIAQFFEVSIDYLLGLHDDPHGSNIEYSDLANELKEVLEGKRLFLYKGVPMSNEELEPIVKLLDMLANRKEQN